MLSGRQISAARALIGMSQATLARAANISVPTLKRMEESEGAAGMRNDVAAVRAVLETAGVTFLEVGGVASGPGVSVRTGGGAVMDMDENEVVQYPENLENDAPPGAGG
ncbi:helix-turn-helix transcriptional regulator [Rhizobium tropici]|uniref:Helix-turn-helix transcriptional regulator n=1 Tax=Rhizobium tropici TaxID=398 RepID=A0A5B0WAN3_RHITR|nr:helix-turn-helix domain-containing protein [Rhizobium tropici]KAA1183943.1 helix-turn-helix transcriptional regulator [Rhizobium tropici]